jgi:hypothetical protein
MPLIRRHVPNNGQLTANNVIQLLECLRVIACSIGRASAITKHSFRIYERKLQAIALFFTVCSITTKVLYLVIYEEMY